MAEIKLLRLPEVLQKVGLGKTSLYERVKRGQFPAPVKLGGGRAIAWRSFDVDEWIRGLTHTEIYGREKE